MCYSYSFRIDSFELLLRWQSLVGMVRRIFPNNPTRCRTYKRREIFLCEVGCRIYVNLRHILSTSMRKTHTIVDVHSIVFIQLHFNYPRTCVNVSSAGDCWKDAMVPLREKNSFAFSPCRLLKKKRLHLFIKGIGVMEGKKISVNFSQVWVIKNQRSQMRCRES